jgi:hypothetical protein
MRISPSEEPLAAGLFITERTDLKTSVAGFRFAPRRERAATAGEF